MVTLYEAMMLMIAFASLIVTVIGVAQAQKKRSNPPCDEAGGELL
ncbi:hypothetical protein CathTA2_3009 [Caldalkalibacillus thermarum TA2.A1]|uniref:Putative holin-like toxin n=1 Tax=Caldalkalibacillus thermarum (strain TA2.A1) TaxID=986075 RepID=F5LAS4_CALTT|nr:hypothetical protein CathTA2_3009 [Caldalkalibacillus thermarum TA2.A1]QZT33771.1 putative holin-like toxin [Caldalkalibacillus thermarum TA2.A1]